MAGYCGYHYRHQSGGHGISIMLRTNHVIIKTVSRIEEIPASDWNPLFAGYLEDHAFFKALEDAHFPEFTFFYIMAYQEGKAVGAASLFLMNFPLDFATDGPLKIFMNGFKKLVPGVMAPRILICGMPIGEGRLGLSTSDKGIIDSVIRAIEGIAQEQRAAIIAFKDFNQANKGVLERHLGPGYFCLDSFPSTEMPLHFKDFDDYLKSLSSVTRNGIKRNLKKADEKGGITFEVTGSLDADTLKDVYALYLQTYAKNQMSLEKLTPDFFTSMTRHMPQETRFFLWKIDGKLAAFAFCLTRNGHFIDYYLGFDYAKAFDYYLYYVRFRDLMRWCLSNGIKTYEMGPTTYEPKRRLGFNLIWLFLYVKHRNKFFNPVFRLICQMIKPSNFDPIFKLKPNHA